jgi:hypothetical protein
MTEQTPPAADPKKKKVHPAAIIGPLVAIFASLFVVIISGNKKEEPKAMELGPDTGSITQPWLG